MNNLQKKWIDCRGIQIHCLCSQNFSDPAKMTLLFIPGIMMPSWIWEKQIIHFSDKYNVVAIDPRSQGDSELVTEGHDAFTMAQDIQEVIQTFGLTRVILVAWSIAVAQAVNYVIHFSRKKLDGLVLVDGIVGMDPTLSFYHSMLDLWTPFQLDRVANTQKFIRSIFKQDQPEQFLAKLDEVALRTPTNTVMTLIYNYMFQDFRPLLSQIQVPTWIATIDGPRLEYMKMMEQSIPNASLEIFSEAGHALFLDQPEKFNTSLDLFIRHLTEIEGDGVSLN